MEDKESLITFTNYDNKSFILHTEEGRHFIISREKKDEIENILQGDDILLKKNLIDKINNIESNQKNNLMFLSDFQFKKTIITANTMKKISRFFVPLFNKNMMIIISIIIICVLTYFFFINAPNVISTNIPLSFSWVLIFFVFFFHEIGHATACIKYKANPGEIGFGITSFLPVMYANVTDAWRLERNERMIVNVGGIYFQNIFSLILFVVGITTKHYELYFISKTIFISTIYQFFPFYKSDGYWILSDIIAVPNLFKTSRDIFYKKITNPRIKLSKKKYLIMFYYLLISGIITFFVIKMGIHYLNYIVNLPLFLINSIGKIINNQFHQLNLDANYLWAVLYIIFTTKMIINNIKIFTLSKGADKVNIN